MNARETTGELRNARRVQLGIRNYLVGEIYGDKKCRWPDGTKIKTSNIVAHYHNDDSFLTGNSLYKVTSWAEDAEHTGRAE